VQETGLGVYFSGLYKTGIFYQSVDGRIHSGAERLTPTLYGLEECTVYLRSYHVQKYIDTHKDARLADYLPEHIDRYLHAKRRLPE
jgi:hypothetical protein